MIPQKTKDIEKCQHLKESANSDVNFCEHYAYNDETPCPDEVKKVCLEKYHKSSCC